MKKIILIAALILCSVAGYIYSNSTFDLVANGYIVAKGRWSMIKHHVIKFKGE